MKVSIRRWLSLAILPAAFAAVLASSPAHAADYTGDCANVPSSVSGNIDITESGACNISHDISATGYISVIANGGNISAKKISAANHVNLKAPSGSIDVLDINSNTASFNGNVLITANGNVKTNSISTNGGTSWGAVEINANTGGGNTLFTIGGTGQSNGVNGTINTSTTTGGGFSPTFIQGGVYITNGDASSTGGITLVNMNSLQVQGSQSRSGQIYLNAQNGTLTLPSGTLSADGAPGYMAGSIALNAATIDTADGTVISASQTAGATGSFRFVVISANTINVAGSGGLTIHSDGNGIVDSPASSSVLLFPKDAMPITSSDNYVSLLWTMNWTNYFQKDGSFTVNGSSSPLNVTVNGDYTRLGVSGNGITFNNKSVSLEAKGATSHEILVAYFPEATGPSLDFTGSGNVLIDASAGTSGAGGKINIYVDRFQIDNPIIDLKANAPTGLNGAVANGIGGIIYVSTAWDFGYGFLLNQNSKATFSANGPVNGTGAAVYSDLDGWSDKAITLWAGSNIIYLGNGDGNIKFSATGGSQGGRGGAVVMGAGSVVLKTANAVDVDAKAGDYQGGGFANWSYVTGIEAGITTPIISAKGSGTGVGGEIKSYHQVNNLDVNKYFKVDGGDSLLSAAENDFGVVTLNNVECQQRTTGQGTWPKSYWNCANQSGSTDEEKSIESAMIDLPSDFKNTLGSNGGTSIYVFPIVDTNNNFFYNYDVGPNRINGIATPEARRAVVFNSRHNGSATDDISDYLRGHLMHEIGHLIDAYNGYPSQVLAGTFPAAVASDETAFTGTQNPQNPTCMQVFNDNIFCGYHSNDPHPWYTLKAAFINPQNVNSEMFAFGFQSCSGFGPFDGPLDNAEALMVNTNEYFNGNPKGTNAYWPGGCP